MIKKLQNSDLEVAEKMQVIFQASYAIEAALLKAIDFPPLKRSLENYKKSDTHFYGYFKEEVLAAVIEIIPGESHIHIRSLVVHPDFFRQGIARKLMLFTLENYHSTLFVVETGVDNGPASQLYEKLGFVEVLQWDTDFGIRKVKFELRIEEK
ncbi:GNAT family N-acetyltransferase [Cellulophaga sp. E16_2]|uniref:GCN5-related N-acetyltransferase n=1 Tax=Cellulophaga algicola (strain DSM 14237 / IC166 / ACAM 630) TaxID=688270 RepID=E6XEJ4_CELAD|nr:MULTISPECIES: GNAT family N-acetyltransferase [Cellulophaga]ADV51322.1 GCN5-related N-acetyltransferase [Cellulophaga algicola DSM 14237]MBO0593697.1 GNAT family N-acetyltransferase [Cellulophaga sp. E16_2]